MFRKVVVALATAVALAIVLPATPALAGSCPLGSACGEPMPKDPQPSPSAEATEEPAPEPSAEPTPESSPTEEPTDVPVPETDPVTVPDVEVGPDPSEGEDSNRPDRPVVNGQNQGSGNGGNDSRTPSTSSGGYGYVPSYVPVSTSSTKDKKERNKRSGPDKRPVVPAPVQPAVTEPEQSGPPWFIWLALVSIAGYGVFYFWRTRRENAEEFEATAEDEHADSSDTAADDTQHARA